MYFPEQAGEQPDPDLGENRKKSQTIWGWLLIGRGMNVGSDRIRHGETRPDRGEKSRTEARKPGLKQVYPDRCYFMYYTHIIICL